MGLPVDLLISNARLITQRGLVRAEIAVDSGKIERVGKKAVMPQGEEVLKLPTSSLLFPGIVDIHAHLRDLELSHKGDFASETQAAASGGITYVTDMPNSRPPTLTSESLLDKVERARGRVAVDFGLNLGVSGNESELVEARENIAFGEIFVGPSTEGQVVGYEELERALRIIGGTGKVACIHAEDPSLFGSGDGDYDHPSARPPEAEVQAIARVLAINDGIGARLHFNHVSTRRGLLTIAGFRSAGMDVTCEVTPHHLMLTRENYDLLGTEAKMNPPLRGKDDVDAMVEGIRSGLVDVIASDHAPHAPEEKEVDAEIAPSGVPGFETFIPSVLTCFEERGIPPSTLVQLASINPSKIFGIPGKGYGRGMDADFVVIDKARRRVDPGTFISKGKYSPFSGMELKYWPSMTLLRGMLISEGGETTIKDRGKFIPAGNDIVG